MNKMNSGAVIAIWKRQFGALLGNPLGYVFILAFVAVSGGFLFIPNSFFARNIADFGILLDIMPWLLVILLPAIAMGSWASERELGTEEQLLTLPLSEVDAVIGKWLAVASFFTLAMLCSLSNVVVLSFLGNPDIGLLIANYLGWWLAGLAFAALSVLASTLVPLPAIAFVFGAFFCSLVMTAAYYFKWFDSFNRGLFSLGNTAIALDLVFLFLALAAFVISARRWQKSQRPAVVSAAVAIVALSLTIFNISVQIDRSIPEADVTSEQLSSMSPEAIEILSSLERPVTVSAFISRRVPPELGRKKDEVENFLKILDRKFKGKIKLNIYRPADALDKAGTLATENFGLQPRKVIEDTVTGREEVEVFLGVAVTSGATTQRIDYFDPGLSVEYELVRTILTVASPGKKVIGIIQNDFNMVGGFDYETRQLRQDWQLVQEWKKQYDVRTVNLDVPVADDVDVLVVPQPSLLMEEQLRNLHDYIWEGRPALLFEDPLPMFTGPDLAASQPRRPPASMGGMQAPQEEQPPKANLQPLFKSLGITMDTGKVLWSDFNPSHEFRNVFPRSLVWSFHSKKGITDDSAGAGIESLLLPWPGAIREAPGKNDEITVKPIVTPLPDSSWGAHNFMEHFAQTFLGMQKINPQVHIPSSDPLPWIAVDVSGRMKRAYPLTKDLQEQPSGNEDPETKPDDGLGRLSENPVHVILIADTDLAHDEFFRLYRNENNQFSGDEVKFLTELDNVQFLSNAIDVLYGVDSLMALRTRRPERRPLTALENVLMKTQENLRAAETEAQEEADSKIKKLNADYQAKLNEIENTPGLDENARKQLRAQVDRSAKRRLDSDINQINQEKDRKMRMAKIKQQREIEKVRDNVRRLAIGLPALVLALLALVVFMNRRRKEQLTIPTSRQRGAS